MPAYKTFPPVLWTTVYYIFALRRYEENLINITELRFFSYDAIL
jgi:hypothetical protein